MVKTLSRTIFFLLGISSLLLGVVGVFLPLLPTTPFILLSAFCFSKSSTRLHHWLITHKVFGKLTLDWQQYGVIRSRVKIVSTVTMLVMVSYPLIFIVMPMWLKALVCLSIACVLVFIWTRPSTPNSINKV